MRRTIFAILASLLEAPIKRVLSKLATLEAVIQPLTEQLEAAMEERERAHKAKEAGKEAKAAAQVTLLQAKLLGPTDKYLKARKTLNVLISMQEAFCFLEGFYSSFKNRWVPTVGTVVLLMGSFKSLTSFLVGTATNTVLLFGVLTVLMYAMHIRETLGKFDFQNKDHVLIAKGLFLATALVKVFYTVLGPGWMIVAVLISAVVVALWIEREDLKILWRRWKNGQKSDDDDDQSSED